MMMTQGDDNDDTNRKVQTNGVRGMAVWASNATSHQASVRGYIKVIGSFNNQRTGVLHPPLHGGTSHSRNTQPPPVWQCVVHAP